MTKREYALLYVSYYWRVRKRLPRLTKAAKALGLLDELTTWKRV